MARVDTHHGTVEGIERPRHHAFLGIPFAAPPTGARRLAAPEPAAAWEGVRRATAFAHSAPQGEHPVQGFAASGPRDEDCLSLNVYTPRPDAAHRPVLFWIHGGGFTHGSGSELLYDGGPLAERGDVVVVTIHYRLGALGFLHLGDLLPGSAVTANAALLDAVAALRWVRDEIAAFGGDPGNVTIFGESAGASAVGCLLAVPAARGLFHRAVLESGTAVRVGDRDSGTRLAEELLGELGLGRTNASGIFDVPAEKIVGAQARVAARAQREGLPSFGPIVDGDVLPGRPFDAVAAGAASGIPLLIGTNRDEVKLFNATRDRVAVSDEQLPRLVRAALSGADEEDAHRLIACYRESRRRRGLPHANVDVLDAIQTDARFRVPATRLAIAQRAHQPHAHLYLFTWESPARHGALGSCHALEMPFVFGTLDAPTQDRFAGAGAEAERLSTHMMDAWIAFARTGDPGHEGVGPWAAYDAAARPTMVFGRESGIQDNPFGDERAAIEPFVR
jgi:para-nitrobenzyl esterase